MIYIRCDYIQYIYIVLWKKGLSPSQLLCHCSVEAAVNNSNRMGVAVLQ